MIYTINKTFPSLFFTGRKLRPSGIGIEITDRTIISISESNRSRQTMYYQKNWHILVAVIYYVVLFYFSGNRKMLFYRRGLNVADERLRLPETAGNNALA